MIGLNTVVHFASFIVFLGMGYWIVALLRDRAFLDTLLRQHANRKWIDWPARFVQRFARAFHVPLEMEDWPRMGPCEIKPSPLVALFLRGQLQAIRCKLVEGKPTVELHVTGTPEVRDISNIFSKGVTVQLLKDR